ncbi:methyl-accepting chemotaxis protein [Spirochaetia bacterium]|nr:methyl-accepting chemotaxis protein [Spirochaetia bacterium]
MKLKVKLTIIISGIMIVVISVLSAVLLYRSYKLQVAMTWKDMKASTALYANEIETHYNDVVQSAELLAQIMSGTYGEIDIVNRRQQFREMIHAVFLGHNSYVGIFTVWKPALIDGMDSDENGNFAPYYFTNSSGVKELGVMPDAQKIIDNLSGTAEVGPPIPRMVNGKMAFTVQMSVPVFNSQGDIMAAVGIIIDLNYSQDLVENTIPFGAGRVELYSDDGIIVASPDKEIIGEPFRTAKIERLREDGVQAIVKSLEEKIEVSFEHDDLFVHGYPFTIGDDPNPWVLVASVPRKTVLKEVIAMLEFAFTAILVSIVISSGVCFLVARGIAKPIVGVSLTLKDISEGEGDLTKSITVKSKDEIGDLAHYFNLTLKKIRDLVSIIKKQSALLFDIGNDLSSNMTETAAAVNEITANIQSIRERVVNQAAGVTETSATMERITVNIDKLNSHIENQGSAVSQSSSAIEELLANIQSVTQTLGKNAQNVENLTEASEVGRTGLEAVARDIQEIARESEGILALNAVMENIASQTNLLSMNAAIEAAHAGEAGKGFAVVADEIRKLAENSGEQSKTISGVLKKIKGSIDKITASTSNVLNRFESIDSGVRVVSEQEENIRNAMEEQNAGSQQILESIDKLNDISQQVRQGSEEMLRGSREVILESKNLENVTEEISGGMNEMALGAEQINDAVNRNNEISGNNKENIEILVKEVSRFKIE